MNYNDFSILTDSEYVKIAKEYEKTQETSIQLEHLADIQTCFNLLNECRYLLFFKNENNYTLQKELNQHKAILNKIIENFEINFKVQPFSTNKIINFNLFNYLKMLYNLKNHLNYCLNLEKNKLILKNSIIEIDNLFNSIFENLSKLNIKIFKFM